MANSWYMRDSDWIKNKNHKGEIQMVSENYKNQLEEVNAKIYEVVNIQANNRPDTEEYRNALETEIQLMKEKKRLIDIEIAEVEGRLQ